MEEHEKFFSISIQGFSHIQNNTPMQDYSKAIKGQNYCIGVVCDGHGASKHFRSEHGSRLAAEATIDKLLDFIKVYPDWHSLEDNVKKKTDNLKISIIADWQNRIENHRKENEFTIEEKEKASNTFRARCTYDIAVPYGTTMLAAVVCNDYYLVMMIGDGAIVKIMPDESAEMVVFPGKTTFDDGPHGVVESLCSEFSFDQLHVICEKIEPNCGVAFALCSDGFSESFTTDKYMFDKFINYLKYYAENGLDTAILGIEPMLHKLTRISPAQDDISIAFVTNSLDVYNKEDISDAECSSNEGNDGQIPQAEDSQNEGNEGQIFQEEEQ